MTLFYQDDYYWDREENKDLKVEYFFKAQHYDIKEPVESARLIMPQDVKIKVDLVETPDVLFNLNSAVPCLDTEGVLIGALLTTLKYASENPSKEVVIFGHTDTSGEYSLNYEISELRAKSVKALLDGKADIYASVAQEKSQVIDYQTILKSLATNYGWSCDPGTPDNSNGPKTQTGLKNFQAEYNQKFSGSLAVDGIIGSKTWGAIGEVIIKLVKDVYGKALPKINYGYSNKGIYPCGERFPIADQEKADYVSKTNRRVEAVFWEKTNAPELKARGDKNTSVTIEECPVYDNVKCEKVKLPIESVQIVEPSGEAKKPNIYLKLEYPANLPHKQFVNLPTNGKDLGRELTLYISAKGAPDGETVTWKVTADPENSKRNQPGPCLRESGGNKIAKIEKNSAKLESKVLGEKASIILDCGLAGGDRFTVEISCGDQKTKAEIITWRRFWYQLTYPTGMSLPSFSVTEKAWKKVYTEIVLDNKKEYEISEFTDLESRGIHTRYKEYIVKPGGSDKEVTVIHPYNRELLYGYYTNTNLSPKMHFIICEHLWAVSREITEKATTTLTSKTSKAIHVLKDVINPYFEGKLVYEGTWKSKAKEGHPDHGREGFLTDEWILLEKDRESMEHVKIQVPDHLKLSVAKESPILVSFKLRTVRGPLLGSSLGHQTLNVYDPSNVTDFNNTLTHEAAHSFNQVPLPTEIPPGMSPHQNQYTEHGGVGSHCNINSAGVTGQLNNKGQYTTGVCVMFHQGDSSCINEFCAVCEPYVKAANLTGFKKT